MDDVSQQLREWAEAVGDSIEAADLASVKERRPSSRPGSPLNVVLVGSAALVAARIVLIAVVARDDNDRSARLVDQPATTTSDGGSIDDLDRACQQRIEIEGALSSDVVLQVFGELSQWVLQPSELDRLTCVFAADAAFARGGESEGSLFDYWRAGVESGPFDGFVVNRYRAGAVLSARGTGDQRVEVVLFETADPLRAVSATLEQQSDRWLIVRWDVEPPCSQLRAASAAPTLSAFWTTSIERSCGQ